MIEILHTSPFDPNREPLAEMEGDAEQRPFGCLAEAHLFQQVFDSGNGDRLWED